MLVQISHNILSLSTVAIILHGRQRERCNSLRGPTVQAHRSAHDKKTRKYSSLTATADASASAATMARRDGLSRGYQLNPFCCSPSLMGDDVALQQLRGSGDQRRRLSYHNQESFNDHSPGSAEKDKPPTVRVVLPPAVEEPAVSYTSTLRNASDKAKVGLLRCAPPSSGRTSSLRSIFVA